MSYTKGIHTIPIKDLELDPRNPRLPERLHDASKKSVLNWMLSDSTLTDLMASIVENNFFEGESLVGINSPTKGDKVLIVEGNRRLASVILLNTPHIADNKIKTVNNLSEEGLQRESVPSQLPVYVVEDRQEVANYLGFRHVSGIKQWPVIAKARYLYGLFLRFN